MDTYDGFAWYRQKVFIPEDLKKHAEDNGGLLLRLARIDDSDVSYFNGQILGSTGGLPPDYQSGYGDLRVYTVPVDQIIWGAQNTIAIRVYDGGGGGGIVGDPVEPLRQRAGGVGADHTAYGATGPTGAE